MPLLALRACVLAMAITSPTSAAEIASNGLGGGPWSDPATWRGKVAPGPGDDVVIQKSDIIVFDRADDGKPSCKKLLIDPKGGLTFKPNAGKLTLAVSEGIETYGVIRLDGTKSASDHFELRLLGATADKRQIKLGKNAALLLYGKAGLPEGRRNVALISPTPADAKEPIVAVIDGEGQVMVDWLRAELTNVKLLTRKIDNTGAKPGERIKVHGCRFTGPCRVYCEACDTPEIVGNTFINNVEKESPEPAIHVHSSPLAEIKQNTVTGPFAIGMALYVLTDAVVTNNVVEKCTIGLSGGYGLPNIMIKQLTVRGCPQGVRLEAAKGVVEDLTIEGSTAEAYYQQAGHVQLNNLTIKGLDKKAVAVHLDTGSMAMLNCNVLPAEIKMAPQKPPEKPGPPPILCQQYVVVAVKGAPANAVVEVRTSAPALAAGAADPNVRNTPAPLVDGLTPLANTLNPLVVNAWTFDLAGKVLPAPEYAIKLLGPAAKEGADRPVLKVMTFRPTEKTFREVQDKTPTLEVKLP